jgi:AcrR family transcriptional regulator
MARAADPHRREEILQAATEVFLEQGYSEARLADIAKRAGVVISTLYLYFDSKEAMVRAIAHQSEMEILEQLLPVIGHLQGRADIEQLIGIVATFAASNRDQLRIFHLDSGLNSVRLRNVRPRRGPRIQQGIHTISTQIEEGHLYPYDPSFVIEMLIGFLRWFVTTYAVLEEEETDSFKEFSVQWLCNALLQPNNS